VIHVFHLNFLYSFELFYITEVTCVTI
jgi:hypothetical protein